MDSIYYQPLPETIIPDRRLGRHIAHDERSRAFPVEAPIEEPVTVRWNRRASIFDQRALASCTGNAMAGAVGCDSRGRTGLITADESLAVEFYSLGTHLDRIRGLYPPVDTGSTGLAVCKAAKKLNFIVGYRHAFSLKTALTALQNGPCLVGMGWLTGCDQPDSDGLIRYKGYLRGGHEVLLRGYDASTKLCELDNSWGSGWGKNGSFFMTADDLGIALSQGGDVTQPVFA